MVLLWVLACVGEPQVHALRGEALGTTWNVKWVGGGDPALDGVIEGVLQEVDAGMSTWRADSEISRIRAARGPVEVSEHTHAVVVAALSLAEQTGGAFDPTVQPLVELWGFHGERRAALPTEAELAAARARVGYQKVRVADSPSFSVDGGGTALDLSAIAKGHAVDRVAGALAERGHRDHMVEIGGEVRVAGRGPSGSGWRLGIERPEVGLAVGEALAAVAVLEDRSLATSGNYRNAYEIDGVAIGHTLDPRTGRPAEVEVRSATVVAEDCQTADGWATALMVLGREGLPLIERVPKLEALLLVPSSDGLVQVSTSGMEAHLDVGAAPGER